MAGMGIPGKLISCGSIYTHKPVEEGDSGLDVIFYHGAYASHSLRFSGHSPPVRITCARIGN